MAKDPVLPLYYNDITTSTQDWSDEEFGAYMRLLIHQWRQGGLPKDYQRLTRIATSLDTNWSMLKSKFSEADGLLKNPVMEEIREKRARHKEKQRDNVSKRYQTSTKHPTKNLPLEEENENEDVVKIYKESVIRDKEQAWKELTTDDMIMEDARITISQKGWNGFQDVDIFGAMFTFIAKLEMPTPTDELRKYWRNWLFREKTDKLREYGKNYRDRIERQAAKVR